MTTPSGRKRVVIVGAGFGGLEAAKVLGSRDEGSRVEVTVVDRLNYFLFQPLLYQVALAGLAATDVAYPIRAALHHRRNVSVLLGEVTGVDVARRQVRLEDGTTLSYDYLILAAGARTSYFGHDEWAEHAPGLKDLDDALEIRRRVLVALESAERATDAAERQRLLTFVVVGGGPTGVELAGAIADLSRDILVVDFRRLDRHAVRVVLVEMADRVLTPFVPSLSDKARAQLEELRVEIRTGVRVEGVDARGAKVGGERIDAGTVLWGAGVRPSPLGAALGVPVDAAGRVIVGPDCAVPGHPELFVIGDMAAFTPAGAAAPLPGTSPVALQQAALGRAQHPGRRRRAAARAVPLRRQGVHGHDRPRARRRPDRAAEAVGPHRVAGVGVPAPVVPGRLPQPGVRVHELDLGVHHLAPWRARHHRAQAPKRAAADRRARAARSGCNLTGMGRLSLAAVVGVAVIGAAVPAAVHANGAFPDSQSILTPADRPGQIIMATNFGVILSPDAGATWLWSCETDGNAYGTLYQMAPAPRDRLFTVANLTLAYSDDGTCSWQTARGVLAELPVTDAYVDPSDANHVLAIGAPGSLYSLFESTDGGATFGAALYTRRPTPPSTVSRSRRATR